MASTGTAIRASAGTGDAEFAELMRDIARVLQPRLAKPPGPGRKRRILYSVLLPGPGTAA
jgi:hypothetical protein